MGAGARLHTRPQHLTILTPCKSCSIMLASILLHRRRMARFSCCHAGLRQLLDSALAQESEAVRVAVLQHFVDKNIMDLVLAPRTIREALPVHRPHLAQAAVLQLACRHASSRCACPEACNVQSAA